MEEMVPTVSAYLRLPVHPVLVDGTCNGSLGAAVSPPSKLFGRGLRLAIRRAYLHNAKMLSYRLFIGVGTLLSNEIQVS